MESPRTSLTMQDARTIIPTFGDWDNDTEIPYTTVFEKVRATKDGKRHSSRGLDKSSQQHMRDHLQGNPSLVYPQYESDKYSNASSELYGPRERSVVEEWGFQGKKAVDVQSSSSRRSSLEQIADHIFTESQHAAGNESPAVISRQATSWSTSRQRNHHVCSRDLREQYVKEKVYPQPMPSGGRPPAPHNQGYQGYSTRVPGPPASPRKERFLRNDSTGSYASHSTPRSQPHQHALQANHRSMARPPDRALPKFGEWDAMDPTGVEFTVIFDKARNERKGSVDHEYPMKTKTSPEVDEDLYKPSLPPKRSNGFWTLICCSRLPSVS